MNKILKAIGIAIMFLVILFASVSVADGINENMTADEIYDYIMNNCVEYTIGKMWDPYTYEWREVPTMVIDTEKIKSLGVEASYGEASIKIKGADGKKNFESVFCTDSKSYSLTSSNIVQSEGIEVDNEKFRPGDKKIAFYLHYSKLQTGDTIDIEVKNGNSYWGYKDENGKISQALNNSNNSNGEPSNEDSPGKEDGNEEEKTPEVYRIPMDYVEKNITSADLVNNKFYFSTDLDGTYEIYLMVNGQKISPMVKTANGLMINPGYDEEDGPSSWHKVLIMSTNYYIEFTDEQIESGIMLVTKYSSDRTDSEYDAYNITGSQQKKVTLFEKIEGLISDLIMGISKTLNYLLSNALEKTITLDDIIFNSYSEIRLDFFKYDLHGNEVSIEESETSTINLLKKSINTWYGCFKLIALVGYIIILVYIGIKILMISTTPDAKAKCKQLFTTWVMGIVLLTFFPYIMKYIIILNNAVVKYIDESRYYKNITTSSIDLAADEGLMYTNYDEVIDFNTGEDYMSKVGKLASEQKKLGFSITYLILTWQLIMMVIYYYKRLFITAFLIIIFPLIALMYVWDKLNDGRSQSLSMWIREFSMTVFVQTFHAIVYVFVVDVIYSTITADSYDFVLLIIVSSFLFAGENILKSIFGGGGEALGSVTQTAGKVALITSAATHIGTRAVKNVVSKDGFLRKGVRSFGEARKWHLLNKKRPDGTRNIDFLSTNEAAERRINKILPSEGEITPTIRKAAEVVDTFNNLDKKKPEEIAKAREEHDRLMKKRRDGSMTPEERKQFDAIMSRSNINMNQFEKLDEAMANAAVAYGAAGNSEKARKKITQNLQLEIEVIINSADPDKVSNKNISKSTNNIIRAGMMKLQKTGIDGIKRDEVRATAREKVQNSNRIYNKISFSSPGGTSTTPGQTNGGSGSGSSTTDRKTAKNARAKSIADQYKDSIKDKTLDSHTERMIDSFAHKIANFEDVGIEAVEIDTAYDMVNSLPTNDEDREIFNQMTKLANLQADIEDLRYLLSKKAAVDNSVTPDMRQKFSTIAKSIESKAVNANVPAYTVDVNIDSKKNNVSVDPYISVIDIINASNNNGGDINNFNNMVNTVLDSKVIEQIVDSKMDDIRTGNQTRWSESKEFAEYALKYLEKESKDYEYEEKTYNGYTASEAKKMERAAYGDFVTNAASALSDAVILPAGAVFGAAVGAAYTTDGMPMGEMAGGAVAGAKAASSFSDSSLPGFANAKGREKTRNTINEKVKTRLENNENASLKARNLFENAQYANRGKADTYLTFDGFTANLIVDANDDLTAIINIRAENAEYVCVNEQPGAKSWQSFQENISYTFRDNDYKKSHSLYVYVKDASGNIKNSVQYNLKP